MPLCGTKKSKRQKRDPSPPYSAREVEAAKEDAEKKVREVNAQKERIDGELKEIKREKATLVGQVADVKSEKDKIAAENEELRNRLKDVEARLSSHADSKVDTAELGTKLQEITVQINEERQQKKALSSAKDELQNEVARANKTLETERNQRMKTEAEKEKFKRSAEATERELLLTKQELEEIKKESTGPRSPKREPTEEWQAKIKQAESEVVQERNQRLEKERELSRLISDNKHLTRDKEDAELKLQVIQAEQGPKDEKMADLEKNLENIEKTYESKVSQMERQNASYKQKLQEAENDKDKLLTRLSSITASQVIANNPTITDLSDPNRPEKLGEQMSLVYDDQWTDATEALADLKFDDNAVVKTLLDLLIAIYEHCKEAADVQLSRIEEHMFLPPLENASLHSPDSNGTDHQPKSPPASKAHSASRIPRYSQKSRPALTSLTSPDKKENEVTDFAKAQKQKKSMTFPRGKGEKVHEIPADVRKGIQDYRKSVFKQVAPVVEKEIVIKLRNNQDFGDQIVDACKRYITRCVELCWLMRIQDPPVVLSWAIPEDRVFDTNTYKYYLSTGKELDYVVWPCMYMFDGGPMIMKGVAEGKKV